MSGNKTSFVEQLKQNPLIFTMLGLIIGGATMEIEGFTGIPFQVVGIFAVLLTLIPGPHGCQKAVKFFSIN